MVLRGNICNMNVIKRITIISLLLVYFLVEYSHHKFSSYCVSSAYRMKTNRGKDGHEARIAEDLKDVNSSAPHHTVYIDMGPDCQCSELEVGGCRLRKQHKVDLKIIMFLITTRKSFSVWDDKFELW